MIKEKKIFLPHDNRKVGICPRAPIAAECGTRPEFKHDREVLSGGGVPLGLELI